MLKSSFRQAFNALCLFVAAAFSVGASQPHMVTTTLSDYAHLSAPQVFDRNPATSADNYLAEVTADGRMTWPLQQMPLRVYIEDGSGTPGYKTGYPDFVRRAFDEWQSVSANKLTWKEVSSPEDANIVCSWTAEARPKGGGIEAGQTKTTIARSPFFNGGRIVSAHVMVLTYLFGHDFSNADIYKTCLHEIGHALGMQGHSSTAGDIMYPVLNPNQTAYLKARDRNTIMALYEQNDALRGIASANYGQLMAHRQVQNGAFVPYNPTLQLGPGAQMPPGGNQFLESFGNHRWMHSMHPRHTIPPMDENNSFNPYGQFNLANPPTFP